MQSNFNENNVVFKFEPIGHSLKFRWNIIFLCAVTVFIFYSCKQDNIADSESKKGGNEQHARPLSGFTAKASMHEIELQWSDTSSLTYGYVLLRGEQASTQLQLVDTLQASARSYVDIGLQCHTLYTYVIYSFAINGRLLGYGSTSETTQADSLIVLTSQTSDHLYSIAFNQTGLGIAVGANGTVLRSTDDGVSWGTVTSHTAYTLRGTAFDSSGNCMIVGDHATVLLYHGGIVSRALNTSVVNDLHAVTFLGRAAWMVVGQSGIVLATQDGGANWARLPFDINMTLTGITFFNTQLGLAVSTGGAILRTTNTGMTWAVQVLGAASSIAGVVRRNATSAVVFGTNAIVSTNDGGITWSPAGDITSKVNDACFLSDTYGVAVGVRGIFYTTSDGGTTWTRRSVRSLPSLFGVSKRNTVGGVMVVGMDGTMAQVFSCDR